jgi:hypothetical protein
MSELGFPITLQRRFTRLGGETEWIEQTNGSKGPRDGINGEGASGLLAGRRQGRGGGGKGGGESDDVSKLHDADYDFFEIRKKDIVIAFAKMRTYWKAMTYRFEHFFVMR